MKKKAIIVDLDGTICLLDQRTPFEYEKCDTDLPHEPIIDIVKRYRTDPEFSVIFLSGREDSAYEKTKEWITKHIGNEPEYLFMRKTKDWRKDWIVKKEIFDAKIKPFFDILFVLDDRNQVVEMWRKEGLVCLQVAEGDF